ncbi:hypothetical protein VaNZ11_016308 [Volvox africanus]|uniref:Mitofilin n=1 Tax=Volvox africanus TaxID=51714 RepID=A0ABQ5SMH3_9CHLO|nr:hypothetical protein VaNZ11_016308 [Volvox africanus]
MQQPEGLLAGPSSHGTAIPQPRATQSAPAGFLKPILGNLALHCGLQTRGGRMGMMLVSRTATSLAASYGRAAFLPALTRLSAVTAATFSTQPSTDPKPGFAPGAPGATPPPPGTSPSPSLSPAAAAIGASTGAAAANTKSISSSPQAPGPGKAPASGSGGNGGSASAGTAVVPSRSSRLGWLIPIIGLPLIAAYYNYQKEYDKEWDRKVEKLMQELIAERRPQNRAASVPPAAPPLPVVVPAMKAPTDEPDIKPAQPLPAVPSPSPSPSPPPPSPPAEAEAEGPVLVSAPEKLAAAVEAAPQPQGPAAPSDTEAAGAILNATEAVQAAELPQPVDVAAAAAAAKEGAPAATIIAPTAPSQTPAATAPALSPSAAAATTTAAALAILQTDAVPSAPLPSGLPPGKLGLDGKDLSPLGLIQHAVTSAGAQVTDWSQWPERYAQAAADSQLIFEALAVAAKWHETQMAEVRGELTAAVQRSEQLQSAGEAAVQRFKELLKQVVESSKEMLEMEVRQAEKRTRLESEKARLADAVQRGEKLEKLRLAVGALSMAHEERVRQAAASQTGHVLAAGAAAVAAAAESGAPLGPAAAALRGVAATDPLVGSVVAALPDGPVSTRSELLHQFRRLRGDLSALSHLPGTRAGIVAVAVARLAAKLKVDESEAVKVLDAKYGSGGVDAALARTESLLAAGQLPAAAELLEAALQGTAAAALASDWLEAVQRRAAAEASVSALNAHAAATWASIA